MTVKLFSGEGNSDIDVLCVGMSLDTGFLGLRLDTRFSGLSHKQSIMTHIMDNI